MEDSDDGGRNDGYEVKRKREKKMMEMVRMEKMKEEMKMMERRWRGRRR